MLGIWSFSGDVNGDGNLDVMTANYASGDTTVMLGNGNGSFQSAVTYGVGFGSYALEVGDLNSDGNLDMVATDYNIGGGNVVLLGNGDGTFQNGISAGPGGGTSNVTLGPPFALPPSTSERSPNGLSSTG